MSNPIVTINVSQQVAPLPSALQKQGAFISQGATITSPGTISLLKQLADLTPLLAGGKPITSISWSGSVATVTTTSPHGYTQSENVEVTIAGASPTPFNGTFLATITGASTLTYPLLGNPGGSSSTGTVTIEDVAELVSQATTFFDQGSQQAVSILELGEGSVNDGVAFLTTWITANPGRFYSYLTPRTWDANANFLTFLGNYNATTAKTYFFVTTTLATYQSYTSAMKCVRLMIESPAYGTWAANALIAFSQSGGLATATTTTNHGVLPGQWFQLAGNSPAGWNGWFLALQGTTGTNLEFNVPSTIGAESVLGTLVAIQYTNAAIPATEFSHAADFRVTLNYAPSSTNKVTPLNFAFLFGVTPFPTQGNAALLSTLDTANVSIVGTGAQGGVSDDILIGGNNLDGNPFNYWYSVDWVQINLQRNVTAALINGSNNPTNPLYYNQPGINVLQQVSVSTLNSGITNGLVLFPVKPTNLSANDLEAAFDADTFVGYTLVNAEPFIAYNVENPNDYAVGAYNGISVEYTPLRGFESITINVTVTNFVAG